MNRRSVLGLLAVAIANVGKPYPIACSAIIERAAPVDGWTTCMVAGFRFTMSDGSTYISPPGDEAFWPMYADLCQRKFSNDAEYREQCERGYVAAVCARNKVTFPASDFFPDTNG